MTHLKSRRGLQRAASQKPQQVKMLETLIRQKQCQKRQRGKLQTHLQRVLDQAPTEAASRIKHSRPPSLHRRALQQQLEMRRLQPPPQVLQKLPLGRQLRRLQRHQQRLQQRLPQKLLRQLRQKLPQTHLQ